MNHYFGAQAGSRTSPCSLGKFIRKRPSVDIIDNKPRLPSRSADGKKIALVHRPSGSSYKVAIQDINTGITNILTPNALLSHQQRCNDKFGQSHPGQK
jgi:hypothetical protein